MNDLLDLSEPISPDLDEEPATPPPFESVKWRVKVGEQVYGPYPRSRLLDFLKEGRVAAHTLLACGQDKDFHRADKHPQLRWDFSAPRKRRFGEPRLDPGEGEHPICNYFIAGKVVSSLAAFEKALSECGRMARISGDMWVLRSPMTVQQVRNKLSAVSRTHEAFVVVNATRDRLAWHNIGVENDVALRDVWDSDEVQ
ncbi:MAG: hypothetical protein R3C52_12735 [Hyphomonadaceae bacterium]